MDKSGEEEKKKRLPLSLEDKKEIIAKHERGVRLVDIAREYGRNPSTIGTVLKQKEVIKGVAAPAKGVTTIAKQRTPVHDEMERLLLLWIKEKERAGDTVSTSVICEKATAIFEDLASKEGGEGSSSQEQQATLEFKASHGWFDRFKKRTGIHSVVRHGEASSSDRQAAGEFVRRFKDMVEEEGYVPEQVFNCDETGPFWKKMPRRTYITQEEKTLPGHKPMKDRFTPALCANASRDCKAKSMGLVVDEEDIEELIEEHDEELSTEDLKALAAMQQSAVEEELFGSETAQEEGEAAASIRTLEIKDILRHFQTVADFVEQHHPEKVFTSRAIAHFDDVCLSHFRNLVKSRQKQTSLDRFFPKLGEPPSKKGKGAGDS